MARQYTQDQAASSPNAESGRRKTRSACDRCHERKLRCVKTKGSPGCKRCADLEAECRYSPRFARNRARDIRPAALAIAPATQESTTLGMPELAEHNWFGTGTGDVEGFGILDPSPAFSPQCDRSGMLTYWPGYLAETLDTNFGDTDESTAFLPPGATQDIAGDIAALHSKEFVNFDEQQGNPEDSISALGTPFTSTVGRLTCLNMALYECARKLPFSNACGASSISTAGITTSATTSGTRQAAWIVVDEVFRVTNDFISLAKSTIMASSIRRIDTVFPVRDTPALHGGLPSDSHPVVTWSEDGENPVLDEATLFLLLSCHCRLVEIYEGIFHAIKKCINGSHAPPHAAAGVVLPRLQVGGPGGFALPARPVDLRGPGLPRATAAMYMVLIATVSLGLWDEVAGVLRKGRDCQGLSNPGAHFGVADPAWDAAMRKTDSMSRTIEAVNHLL